MAVCDRICHRCLLLSEADELAVQQLASCNANERWQLEVLEDKALEAAYAMKACEDCATEQPVEGWA